MFIGTAGNSLKVHNGMSFSTYDKDNDVYESTNCADKYNGGWWYKNCFYYGCNLNGEYGNTGYGKGINYYTLTGYYTSLSYVEIKIREKRTAL